MDLLAVVLPPANRSLFKLGERLLITSDSGRATIRCTSLWTSECRKGRWYPSVLQERDTARVFSRDSPGKVAQWTGRPIRES
jgi:hypothetical protein